MIIHGLLDIIMATVRSWVGSCEKYIGTVNWETQALYLSAEFGDFRELSRWTQRLGWLYG